MTRSILLSGLIISTIMISGIAHAQTLPQPAPSGPVVAPQVTPAPRNVRAELEAIGKHLEDDRVDLYDRYVYNDAQTIDKNVSLSLPVLTNQDIQEWLTERVASIMTITPNTAPVHQNKIAPYFTSKGLAELGEQWREAGIPDLVAKQHYSMSALVIELPRILAKGRQKQETGKSIYRWIVDVPILLNYVQPTQASQAFPLTLRIGVTRIPLQKDARLIAIDSWAIAPVPKKPVEENKDSENSIY